MVQWENFHKLVTKEDPMHLHKLLGTFCLVHFAYRYAMLFTTGSMQLHRLPDLYMVSLHGVLSVSSLVFHIPGVRNPSKPMIYPEFRAHSILFAMRSVIACWLHYYRVHCGWNMLLSFHALFFADLITGFYRVHGAHGPLAKSSTMRSMPFGRDVPKEDQQSIVSMQSRMQIGATLYTLVNMDAAFSPLLAIQLAALLMTMVRKSILSAKTWHLIYSLSLWLNYELLVQFTPGQLVIFTAIYNWHHRVFFPWRVSKYLAWTGNYLVYLAWTESGWNAQTDVLLYHCLESVHVTPRVWYWLVKIAITGYYVQNYRQYRVLFHDPEPTPDPALADIADISFSALSHGSS